MNISVIILLFFTTIELIFLKYDLGWHILEKRLASIIENVCYSLIASVIFYIVQMIPTLRRQKYYEKILSNKKLRLFTTLNSFIDDLIDLESFEKRQTENSTNNKKDLKNSFNRNDQRGKKMSKLRKGIRDIKIAIDDILKYSEYLDSKIVNLLNQIIYYINVVELEKKKDKVLEDIRVLDAYISQEYGTILKWIRK
jgi:hypothetical protein